MSVLKQNRGESSLQFLDNARKLEIYSLRNCFKFPKRYTFLFTNEIANLSKSIYNNVKSANSIFPNGELEYKMRKEYLTKAICELQCLISQLDIAKELFGSEIKASTWCNWMDMIEEEIRLVSAVKKKDKEKYHDSK